MDPPSIEDSCLAYWYTKSVSFQDLVQCIYIGGRYPPPPPTPVVSHEVTNTKFHMNYPDRLSLTSSVQEW